MSTLPWGVTFEFAPATAVLSVTVSPSTSTGTALPTITESLARTSTRTAVSSAVVTGPSATVAVLLSTPPLSVTLYVKLSRPTKLATGRYVKEPSGLRAAVPWEASPTRTAVGGAPMGSGPGAGTLNVVSSLTL